MEKHTQVSKIILNQDQAFKIKPLRMSICNIKNTLAGVYKYLEH